MRWMLTTAKKILSHNNDYSMDAVSSINIEIHAFFPNYPACILSVAINCVTKWVEAILIF